MELEEIHALPLFQESLSLLREEHGVPSYGILTKFLK